MSESTGRTPRALRLSLSALLVLLVATACQMTEDPSASKLRDALETGILQPAGFDPDATLRVRYLPPIGNTSSLKGLEFVAGMPIEMAVFALAPGDGEAVGPILETFQTGTDAELTVAGDTYRLAWPASDPVVAERVRLEFRMVGSGEAPVCNVYEGECLGFLDVSVVEESGPGSGGGDGSELLTISSGTVLNVGFKVTVPSELAELATLAGQGGIDPEAGSCPAHEVAMPSQGMQLVGAGLQAVGAGLQAVGAGLQAVGAGGGLFAAPLTGDDSLAGRVVELDTLGELMVDFDGDLDVARGDGINRTVIFVLDDFGGRYVLPDDLLEDDIDLPDTGTLGYDYSHGALVLYELRTLLDGLFDTGKVTAGSGSYRVDYAPTKKKSGVPTLRLQAVDARAADGDIDTDVAVAALAAAMSDAAAAGYTRAVVNMSFSIVPCDVMDDFDEADPITFEEYVGALLAYNGVSGSTADAMANIVQSPVELSDALLAFLACPRLAGDATCGSRFDAVVNVAASGNYGLDFPLYPAASPGVVSVGSQPHDGSFQAGTSAFSNAAAVVAAGDVILLRADTRNGAGLAYMGTSFSAPLVSAFVALDLRAGTPTCGAGDAGDQGASPPELAAGLSGLPLLPGMTAGGGASGSAVEQLCSGAN